MFVIIKSDWPPRFMQNATSSSRNDVQDEEHGVNIQDQVNDPMEEDENNNIFQDHPHHHHHLHHHHYHQHHHRNHHHRHCHHYHIFNQLLH